MCVYVWDLMCLNSCSSSRVLLTFLLIGAHFLEALSVCSANEVCLHIVNAALWIHQVLIVLALYLDHTHDYAVDHVDRFAFVLLTVASLLVILDALLVLVEVVLNALSAIVINVIRVVLQRGLPLVEAIILIVLLVKHILLLLLLTLLGARLKLNIVHWVLVPAIDNVVVLGVELLVLLAEVIDVALVQVRRLGLLTQHVLVHCMSVAAMLISLVQEDGIRYWPLSLTL